MINQALEESFRCPQEFCSFALGGELSTTSGYFRFGKDAVCYGRSVGKSAKDPSSPLYDALQDVRIEDSAPILPFDPMEVIRNLQLERYAAESRGTGENILYEIYYRLRPFMPVGFRKHLQRMRLRGARNLPFPHWPVDSTVEHILERLLGLALKAHDRESIPFVWFWPHGLPSCAIITHDVEAAAGLEFCSTLMDIDDSYGIKSSFQLVPEQRYSVSDRVLGSFRDRGFEVNVHDLNHDGHLYSEREEFLRRANRINQYARSFGAVGFRSGAMYRNLSWYDAFEFSYDMSVPSVGHLEAQGGGCCCVRPFFINKMVELPLTTTQDYSLFHILGDYSIDIWKQQIKTILNQSGLITFIIHPDYIIERKAQDTYKSLLAYLSKLRDEGKLWIPLPGEVASWWKQRNEMKLVHSADTWHITGSGQGRARVAYAYLGEEGIAYRM
jgi:hypothetical protein